MGCVQGKGASSMFSPPLGLEKLKLDHGYVGGVQRQPGNGSAAGDGRAGEIRGRGDAGDDVVKEAGGMDGKRMTDAQAGGSRVKASILLHPAPVRDALLSAPLGLEGGMEEIVEGWPRWLLQNIPREALVKFVPKSADDYIMIKKIEQLHRIFKLCGSPSEDYFKRFEKPTTFRPPQPYKPSILETFRYFPPSSLGLLSTLLALEPSYRSIASAALQNEFFRTSPLACDLSSLPVIYKGETDEWRRPRERRKSKTSKSRRESHTQVENQQKSVEATGCPTADSWPSKELSQEEKAAELIMHNQELGSSIRSASSNQNSIKQTVSPPSAGGSALLVVHESHMTDCHPSATKNIENFPPLPISKLYGRNDGANNSMLHGLGRVRRNASSSDFRRLVAEKMLKHQQYFD